MRPDEHKKKKNAEYKKKHGIPGKKGAIKTDEKPVESAKSDGSRCENKSTAEQATEKNAKVDEVLKADDGERYARRHVTRNWDKYDGLDLSEDEDEDERRIITSRGTDFATLVERAGDPNSQFRFQAEKEWEDVSTNSQAIPAGLEINFGSLTEALRAIPLHRRLNLEQEEVCPGLQVHLDSDTEDLSAATSQTVGTTSGSLMTVTASLAMGKQQEINESSPPSTKQNLTHENQDAIRNSTSQPETISLHSDPIFTSIKKDIGEDRHQPVKQGSPVLHLQSSIKGVSDSISLPAVSRQSKTQTSSTESVQDDELDFLLSLESDTKSTASSIMGNRNEVEPMETRKSVTCQVKSSSATGEMNTPESQGDSKSMDFLSIHKLQTTQKPKEDLEDWLDSVLG